MFCARSRLQTPNTSMKQLITSIVAALTVAATVHAGIPNYSLDRPGSESGRGLYLAAQGGVNLYQSTANDTIDGVALTSKSKVGGFGGLKLGYVFGTVLDTVRPAAEIDGFYNGFSQSATADYLGYKIDDIKVKVNSGALMANGLVRFALSSFQPYIGVGVGGQRCQSFREPDRFCMAVACRCRLLYYRQRQCVHRIQVLELHGQRGSPRPAVGRCGRPLPFLSQSFLSGIFQRLWFPSRRGPELPVFRPSAQVPASGLQGRVLPRPWRSGNILPCHF